MAFGQSLEKRNWIINLEQLPFPSAFDSVGYIKSQHMADILQMNDICQPLQVFGLQWERWQYSSMEFLAVNMKLQKNRIYFAYLEFWWTKLHVAWHINANSYSQTFNYMCGSESENKIIHCIPGS